MKRRNCKVGDYLLSADGYDVGLIDISKIISISRLYISLKIVYKSTDETTVPTNMDIIYLNSTHVENDLSTSYKVGDVYKVRREDYSSYDIYLPPELLSVFTRDIVSNELQEVIDGE